MSRVRLALRVLAGLLALTLAALLVDIALLRERPGRMPLTPTAGPAAGAATGTTWLVLGSDRRTAFDNPEDAARYRSPTQSEGERADVVLLVRRDDDGNTAAISVPRDLLLTDRAGHTERLATTLDADQGPTAGADPAQGTGPQRTVNMLCEGLGVGVDHLVVVDFTALVRMVDALGGIDVQVDEPLRDRTAKIELTKGVHHFDGAAALAYARARHPDRWINGEWVFQHGGTAVRNEHITEVATLVADAAAHDPIDAHAGLWAALPHTRVDDDFGILSSVALARSLRTALGHGHLATLPHRFEDGPVPIAFVTPATKTAIAPFATPGCHTA